MCSRKGAGGLSGKGDGSRRYTQRTSGRVGSRPNNKEYRIDCRYASNFKPYLATERYGDGVPVRWSFRWSSPLVGYGNVYRCYQAAGSTAATIARLTPKSQRCPENRVPTDQPGSASHWTNWSDNPSFPPRPCSVPSRGPVKPVKVPSLTASCLSATVSASRIFRAAP